MKLLVGILVVVIFYEPLHAQKEVLMLTLEEYVKRAQELGKDARLADYAFKQAGYSRDISYRRQDSPKVTGSADVNRTQSSSGGSTSTSDTQNTSIKLAQPFLTGADLSLDATRDINAVTTLRATLSQPIYLFVKNSTLRSRLLTTFSFQNAQDTFDKQNLLIRSGARSLYFSALSAEEEIKVNERKLESSRKLVDITEALVQGGKEAAVELMRTKLSMQKDERNVRNSILKRDQIILNLKNYISLSLDQSIRLSSKISFSPFKRTLDDLVNYALVHEPGLRSSRRSKEIAQISLQEAREAQRPKLAVNGGYNYTAQNSQNTKGWTVGGSLQWLLFDSFVSSKQIQSARISLIVAEVNYSEAERNLRQEIESKFLSLKNSEQQIRDFQTTREQSKRNLEVIQLRFQNGKATLLDVFDVEDKLRDSELEYLKLLISFNDAKDSLSALIGGDVETLP